MKTFNKKTKTALMLGGVLLSGLAFTPAFAEEVATPNSTESNKSQNEMRLRMEDRGEKMKMKKIMINDKKNPSNIDPEKIRKAIEAGTVTDLNKILSDAGIKYTLTDAQFILIKQAYSKAKAGDIEGAQKIIKDNNLDPMLHRFIMGQHMELTDSQKEAVKKAEALMKEGKTDEAKAVLAAAGLPKMEDKKIEKPAPTDVSIKTALDKAKALYMQGKESEAKQVLTDAGVSSKAIEKIQKEFDKTKENQQKKSVFQKIKNFFKFGKN